MQHFCNTCKRNITKCLIILLVIFSPPVQFAGWANMCHFLSVCCLDWTENGLDQKHAIRSQGCHGHGKLIALTGHVTEMLINRQRTIVVTEWAHCQCQVVLFKFNQGICKIINKLICLIIHLHRDRGLIHKLSTKGPRKSKGTFCAHLDMHGRHKG